MISGSFAETGTKGAVEGSVSPIHDAQQLPVLPPFKGAKEDAEEDSFEEWVDHLEEMGVWCRCDDHKKLTQLRLRLEGPARSFYKYKSYSESEKRSYDALKPALVKRFTPVRLTAELRKLLYKAYPPTYRVTPEPELLGKRSILSNQSVVEGNFEDLVYKARLKRQSGRRQTLGQQRNQGEKKPPRKPSDDSEEK
uniref:Uncharacterized protein n=1 Tax=Amphimedon queenslandica TaxID=400682 RepID=A0A1X7T230_AMPQE